MNYKTIIDFWFDEIEPKMWWQKDSDFDHLISDRFLDLHTKAKNCELFTWRQTALGSLAEIIILDQFSRNIFRDKPEAFAQDNLALALSQRAIEKNFDQELEKSHRSFVYMPYMHSESLVIHEEALNIFNQPGLENTLDFELKHKKIIEQFGRYPHRNKILNRPSTAAEIDFLKQPNSSF